MDILLTNFEPDFLCYCDSNSCLNETQLVFWSCDMQTNRLGHEMGMFLSKRATLLFSLGVDSIMFYSVLARLKILIIQGISIFIE